MNRIDYSKKWQVLLAVSFGGLLATVDSSIVNISLPTLEKDLNASFATIQWVVLAYLLTVTVLLLGIGRLADISGKKSIFVTGFVVFTLGSLFCGLSSSAGMLIAFRILQAIGAACLMALGPALLAESFPPEERGSALGINGLSVSLGIILGPTLGGIILANLGWHWIFFVNVPVGLIAIPVAIRSLPVSEKQRGEVFDFPGAIALFCGLSSLLFALTISQEMGFLSLPSVVLFFFFIFCFVLFIRIEKRVTQPVIELDLFTNKLFSVNLITGFLTFVASAGTVFLIPFYLQNVLGFDPEMAGLLMAVFPVMLGIAGPISGWLSDRFGFRLLTVIGLAVLSLSYFNLSRLSILTTWQEFILFYSPIGIGMGLFQSPNNSAILGAASTRRLGVASGLLAITRTLGQTSGIAVMGALWTAMVFRQSGYLAEGATAAPAAFQVSGLHITCLSMGFLLAFGLVLSLIAWRREAREFAGPISKALAK
ncbi:MAG: MFS transporter [Leptolinea sp.]|jgi:EmrB/QacA subfamily drug resistance transporter|nr:MFS transporter [Leptolinea sp.]